MHLKWWCHLGLTKIKTSYDSAIKPTIVGLIVNSLLSVLHFETMVDKKTELLLLKAPLVEYDDDHLPGKLTDESQPCKCEKHSPKPGDNYIRLHLSHLAL